MSVSLQLSIQQAAVFLPLCEHCNLSYGTYTLLLVTRTNSQALLRELRYDPRLRLLTSFPVVETEQLRGSTPMGELPPDGLTLTSAANHTVAPSGANQSEVRMTVKLSTWKQPTTVGLKVLAADPTDAAAPSVVIYLVLYPRPSGAGVWRARLMTQREGWGPNGVLDIYYLNRTLAVHQLCSHSMQDNSEHRCFGA